MATTEHFYTGNNSTTSFAFTFPYLTNNDVKVELDNVVKTENSSGQTNNDYTINNTNIVFNTAPGSGVAIHIYRTTNVDTAQATFAAGSSIRAADLNNNQTQALYSAQESAGQLVRQSDLKDSIVTSAKIVDGTIATGDLADSLITTAKINADAVTNAKIADDQIDSEHYVAGSIDTEHIADSQVTTAKIADSNVTTAKIADSNVTTAKIADGSVTTAKINNAAVTTGKLADDAVTNAKIGAGAVGTTELNTGAVTTAKLASDSVTNAKISAGAVSTTELDTNAVTTAKITNDAVTNAKIAAGAVGTNELDTGAVTTAKIANSQVTSTKIADGNVNTNKLASSSVTTAKIAASSVNESKISNAAITTAKIADTAVTTAKIANDAVVTSSIGNNAVSTAKLGNDAVTTVKIANDAVTTGKIADSELKTLAGMQSATASKLADSTALTADIADLNQIDGLTKQTTISDSDASFPTSGAVVDYVAAQIAPLGGLEVIATEVAFPNTQPSAGVVISISDAGGVVFNGSGTSTTGRTVGGSTITINNAPSSLNGETLVAGVGLMVSSTGSGQVYNYHKILGKEDDIKQLSDDINDFNARYRVGSSNPTSALDAGDLFFNTSTQKLLVYNTTNSAWEEAQSIGNFFISTLSPAFDGITNSFTITNAPSNAQQILLSINGVVQKPNSGTSAPSEGFALDGSTIKLPEAPPTGSSYFAVVLGSTVNIGAPSDNTVSTAKLQNSAVTTAKILNDAVSADKIGTLTGNVDFNDNAYLKFGNGNDLEIYHDGSSSYILNKTGNLHLLANSLLLKNRNNDESYIRCFNNAEVSLYYDNSKKFETTSGGAQVTGNLSITNNLNVQNDLIMGDTDEIQMGDSLDFRIYHTSGTNYIEAWNNSNFKIAKWTGSTYENMITAASDGSVELYFDASKKLETTSSGVKGYGTGVGHIFLGDFRVKTEADANFVTFKPGESLVRWHDNHKAVFGASNDLQIYHTGSHSFIENSGTGNLIIESQNTTGIRGGVVNLTNVAGNANLLVATAGGSVDLYHNNSKKLETASDGVNVTGNVNLGDHNKLTIGAGGSGSGSGDLELHHVPADSFSYIDTFHNLAIRKDNGHKIHARFMNNAQVELYHNNSKTFETTTNGIKVIGESDATAGAIELRHSNGKKNSIGTHFASNAYDSRVEIGISDGSTSGGTNRVASFSYAGLSFGTDTASANRLDDYEEGTGFTAGSNSAVYQSPYVKVGKSLTMTFRLSVNSGQTETFNLPYAMAHGDTHIGVAHSAGSEAQIYGGGSSVTFGAGFHKGMISYVTAA